MKLGIPDLAILVTNVPTIGQKDNAIGIIMAESGGISDARNHVNNPTSPAHNSFDRGIWQINSYWHARLSDAACDDPLQATLYAASISQNGTIWTPWVTFNHGSHIKFLTNARLALAAILE